MAPDAEFAALVQHVFRKDIYKHLFRGYSIMGTPRHRELIVSYHLLYIYLYFTLLFELIIN
jgi:hypothetical protein